MTIIFYLLLRVRTTKTKIKSKYFSDPWFAKKMPRDCPILLQTDP